MISKFVFSDLSVFMSRFCKMCSDSIDVTARHALVHAMVADPDPDVLVVPGSVFFSEVGFGSGTVMRDTRSFTT